MSRITATSHNAANSQLTAASRDLASCHLCLQLASRQRHHCPRCGTPLHLRKPDSLQRTLALLVTACLIYIPANIFPIMITEQFGQPTQSTIIGGVVLLIAMDSWAIAAVIFIASVMVPVGKLLMLFFLCLTVYRGTAVSARQRTVAYRITEYIGRWSMVDVFVVAILAALVRLGGLLVIRPGVAALAFAALVIISMLAAESFDPRLLWDQQPAPRAPIQSPAQDPAQEPAQHSTGGHR